MKKPETLSYIAIALSVVAIIMCLFCGMGCKKGKMMHKNMKHRGPQVEMVVQGEHHHDGKPCNKHHGDKPIKKQHANKQAADQARQ